eukprot:SAG31_NODE_9290_length_1303_cov_1.779070_1_plen_206_part_00
MSGVKSVPGKRSRTWKKHSPQALVGNVFAAVQRYKDAGWLRLKGKSRDIACDMLGMSINTLASYLSEDCDLRRETIVGEEEANSEQQAAAPERASSLLKKFPDLILDARRECAAINQRQPPEQCTLMKKVSESVDKLSGKTIVRCYAKTRKAQNELWWRFKYDPSHALPADEDGNRVETESDDDPEDEALDHMDLGSDIESESED